MKHFITPVDDRSVLGLPFKVLVAAAITVGLYARLKGLGTWPLGVDEFYVSRSVDNILKEGVPRFICGGYYMRGLLYQYAVAALRLCSLSPELAGRTIAVVCSLAVLPAGYLLGRRLGGPYAGWATLIILSLSVWEIEMARFARMYAPFQAVFAWYTLFFLRYAVDGQASALVWMVVLSIAGILTWEGGALMGLANLLAIGLTHQHGRLKRLDAWRLAGLSALLGFLYIATRDLRGYATLPDAALEAPQGHAHRLLDWIEPILQHPHAALAFLVPLGLTAASLPYISSFRRRWIAACGLALALLAAALHLFVVAAAVLALLLLFRLVEPRELFSVRAAWYWAALSAFLLLWLLLDYTRVDFVTHFPGGLSSDSSSVAAIRDLLGYPDLYGAIVRPWGRTMPVLTALIGAALLYWFWMSAAQAQRYRTQAALLALVLAMALSVGFIATQRIETRYTFFLYPACLALLCAAALDVSRHFSLRPAYAALPALVPLLCFAASEDFQPRHLARIDSAQVNFRRGMSPALVAHYYPRNDMREVGQWLAANVGPGDVVVSGIPNLAPYYAGYDFFYFAKGDERYESYVCPNSMVERWSGRPVLYGEDQLGSVVKSGRRVFVVVYQDVETDLLATETASTWSVRRAWSSEHDESDVLLLATSGSQP